MFDPLFDVQWFVNEWALWVALAIGVLTFVGFFVATIWLFIDDFFDKDVTVGSAIGVTIVFPVGVFVVSLGVLLILPWMISYGWFPLSIIASVVGMAYIARGVRRLQKDMKKHIADRNAHKGGE